ncbi:hypothetical protein SAMN03080601_02758 [Alkalitalea saponilacus]|uniref:Uncharacterized protein n=1 Tax=Alkalitalea saponilacus TaxID=889453 RepID=A0A1T5HS09_9BACT|nr:hypothetical protein SAMN03080601_02758 [Alkalitalea saponilacus]
MLLFIKFIHQKDGIVNLLQYNCFIIHKKTPMKPLEESILSAMDYIK